MAIKLSEIAGGAAEMDLEFPGGILHISYDPNFYTAAFDADLRRIETVEGWAAANAHRFISAVKSWDLVSDKGKPVPITQEGLAAVPVRLQTQILSKAAEKLSLGEKSAAS